MNYITKLSIYIKLILGYKLNYEEYTIYYLNPNIYDDYKYYINFYDYMYNIIYDNKSKQLNKVLKIINIPDFMYEQFFIWAFNVRIIKILLINSPKYLNFIYKYINLTKLLDIKNYKIFRYIYSLNIIKGFDIGIIRYFYTKNTKILKFLYSKNKNIIDPKLCYSKQIFFKPFYILNTNKYTINYIYI